ncbi:MAG: hypothetical protein NT175_10655 [Bacteroidetes bacterium]|nr:hypothetical protein [Bacteroidota bacterium]
MKKLIFLLIIFMLQSEFCMNKNGSADKEVQNAFETRMSGQVDQAKTILDNVLKRDSTNAMAYYELARIKMYMLTGGSDVSIENILSPINKAVGFSPRNVTYAYFKAITTFFRAYMALESESEKTKDYISETCQEFEKVLKLNPDHKEAMLYLVEIYGMLPKDIGGDSIKAAMYAGKLEKMNAYYGAKARLVLSSEDTDPVKYWQDYLAGHKKDADILAELDKACLYKDDPDQAEKYMNEAIALDPSKNILLLDLARYHMMKVMGNKDLAAVELPLSTQYFEKYISSTPAPVVPLHAYAIGCLARIKMFSGNKAEGEKLMEQAQSLDPYFSRAFGVPSPFLFDPPDKANNHFVSFFRPF